ncbi:EpsG family protein [Fontimonas thermophila]|nr:EpsG family protein [Fontimonas thermophila]
MGIVLVLMIGFRFEVGGDWFNYQAHYFDVLDVPLGEVLERPDPGYYLLTWLSAQWGLGVFLVNTVCGVLFSWGLLAFCQAQPRPWLALAVAVPYLVTVVAMGYSRQGVAIGLAMLGLVRLARHQNLQFVLCVGLAATFHKTAVLLIPLAVLANPRGRLWSALWVGITAALMYWALLAESVDALVTNYIVAEYEYESEGAAIRVTMNALPAMLLLLFRRRVVWQSAAERNLWSLMAWAALATIPLLILLPSSTAVDRMALYLIPLQPFVFSRLPDWLARFGGRRIWIVSILAYYAAVLFVWLLFASHAQYWLPYRFYLFELL